MIRERIARMRLELKKENIDYYIVPTADYHNSEYVSPFFKFREYLSGFTGSAGTLVVSEEESILWTDGRYFIQAEEQLQGTGIELYKSGNPGVPEIKEYLKAKCEELSRKNTVDGSKKTSITIGFDGRVMELSSVKNIEKELRDISGVTININPTMDLSERVWTDRPELKFNEIYCFPLEYAGKSSSEKINEVRLKMSEKNADFHLIASLDDIAWLLNLRGSDIACNPVFLSYFFISEDDAVLFCDQGSVSGSVMEYLEGLGIRTESYDKVYDFIKNYGENHSDNSEAQSEKSTDNPSDKTPKSGTILLDEDSVNYRLYSDACASFEILLEKNPSERLKSIKNETEINNLRKANIVDGIAMVRFLKWLDDYKNNKDFETVTELMAAEKLLNFRKLSPEFKDISFDTIAAYGPHGAIVHYEPEEKTDIPIERKGFLLVDSGAQYLNGTTDVTRTIALGEISDEMKKHYTAVLKGHLRLASAIFPEDIAGANLDILARGPLWDMMLDYNHGTGHGIGYFLNVHEGPQNINWKIGRRKGNAVPLAPGMVTSDEPGFYKEGQYGIRIENDVLTVLKEKNEYASFMGFELLTLAPIDLSPVLFDELDRREIEALDHYHDMVYERLSPYLDAETAKWLKKYISH